MDSRDPDAPLRGVGVVEIAGELTGYAGKLLADLGAAVTVVELEPGTDREEKIDPRELFLHHDKSRVQIGDADDLVRLIGSADVILQTGGGGEIAPPELAPAAVRASNPAAIHAILTPFGLSGPKAGNSSTDLTRLAAGGLLALGGYPDTEPVAAFGEQTTVATGIYGAVAVVIAMIARQATGRGETIEVSSQEVVTQALETALAEYELLGKVRRRLGDTPREAGTGIFPCADGHVSMVAGRLGTAAAWKRLVDWLAEAGTPGAQALAEPHWETLTHRQRPEAIAEFSEVFGRFAATRSKHWLYREGQERSIAMAPVNDVADVLDDPQLAARGFFHRNGGSDPEATLRLPSAPFRLSRPTLPPAAARQASRRPVTRSLAKPADGGAPRVLEGLRVLDFCWVGAGALVTKFLAEQGADVIKVESRARPDNLRVAPPFKPGAEGLEASGYFASRNNDKRSLALNMRKPRSREIARDLARHCDIVTSNFRPGVMEGWGLDYETLSSDNPSLVYLAMPMNGSSGPDSRAIGFGSTIAAQAGLVYLSGRPDRTPIGTGTHYPDHIPSPGHALVAVLSALLDRNLTGAGRMIEISQLESAVSAIGPAIVAGSIGEAPFRAGNRVAGHHPSGVFPCAGDDRWIAIAVRGDDEWRKAAGVLSSDLAGDQRFASVDQRAAAEEELERLIADLTSVRDRDELAERLQESGVPASAVLSSEDLLRDAHLRERGFWRELPHPVLGTITMSTAAFRTSSGVTGPERAAPLLGEHSREIMTSLLGLTDAEVDALVQEEVVW